MNGFDYMAKNVVKVVCNDGSTGTGFFFAFTGIDDEEDYVCPTIITNKHVVENAKYIDLIISKNDYFSSDNKEVVKINFRIDDLQNRIIYHPKEDIDLCVIPISDLEEHRIDNKIDYQITYLTINEIPSEETLKSLNFVEEIIMVGYPRGIADNYNNFPIFRKGITATHPAINFDNNKEFIIDMTITPGSSGSPVFLYNHTGYRDKNNFVLGTSRLLFLGINRAVFIENNVGKIEEYILPTNFYSVTKQGINLGIILKAELIKDFEKYFIT